MNTSHPSGPAFAQAEHREFARFGPWIDVVESPAQVPRLFREHPLDLDAARLVLKVPRNIARRDATPDMDLYDHLIVVNASGLTVLSRCGQALDAGRGVKGSRGYEEKSISFESLAAIEDSVNLLEGRFALHTVTGESVTMSYSGSARAAIRHLTSVLRQELSGAPDPAAASLLTAAAGRDAHLPSLEPAGDLALTADLRDVIASCPDVTAWACHARLGVTPRAPGIRGLPTRVAHALAPVAAQGCVVAGDTVALEVLGRHTWMARRSTPMHSASRLTVALARLDRISMAMHPQYKNVEMVVLDSGSWSRGIVVPTRSATAELFRAAARN